MAILFYCIVGLAVIEDGATVMHVPGKLVPLMLAKSDGAHTYDTSDMAALRHRIEEEKGDWLIYVVDAGQVHCTCNIVIFCICNVQ